MVRVPKAYPVYDDAYKSHVQTIRNYLYGTMTFLAAMLKPLEDVTEADVIDYLETIPSNGSMPMNLPTIGSIHRAL